MVVECVSDRTGWFTEGGTYTAEKTSRFALVANLLFSVIDDHGESWLLSAAEQTDPDGPELFTIDGIDAEVSFKAVNTDD